MSIFIISNYLQDQSDFTHDYVKPCPNGNVTVFVFFSRGLKKLRPHAAKWKHKGRYRRIYATPKRSTVNRLGNGRTQNIQIRLFRLHIKHEKQTMANQGITGVSRVNRRWDEIITMRHNENVHNTRRRWSWHRIHHDTFVGFDSTNFTLWPLDGSANHTLFKKKKLSEWLCLLKVCLLKKTIL